MITLKDVSLSDILKNISISLPDGGYIGITGPNGSGKSTLAKVIKGIQDPSSGTVYVKGAIRTRGKVSTDIGLVLSNPENQLVSSSIEEDAAFGLENMNLPSHEIAKRTEEVLKWANLWDIRDIPAHHLSAGQQQMVVIAGIICMQPDCLILDEATSMIDPQGRSVVLDAVKRINRERGVGVIHISHDLSDLMSASTIYILNMGSIVWEGSPSMIHHQDRLLEELAIELPFLLKLKSLMVKDGYDVSDEAMTVDEMADEVIKAVKGPRLV